jgi:hypothetical protein
LKRLELYSDVAFGWYPKLDLRGVHFPKLESLALGHFIFSRDQQFDWIISHSQTLKDIFLDNCSILYQIGHDSPPDENWLDQDGCPSEHKYSSRERDPYFVSYYTRWYDVFDRFSHSLPNLKAIWFGSSPQWKFDTPNRYDDASPGLPIIPWRSERDMKNEMFERRYVIWSNWTERYRLDWTIPVPVVDEDGYEVEDIYSWTYDEEPDIVPQMDERPGCDEEDWVAFRALQRKVGQA